MDTSGFRLLFLTLLAVHFLLERFLSVINVRYSLSHQHLIPESVKSEISEETRLKSLQYLQTRSRFGHVSSLATVVIALTLLFSGLIAHGDEQLTGLTSYPLTRGVILLLGIFLLNAVLSLPMSIYETFRIEARFGFNQTTWMTFLMDQIKSLVLTLLIGVPFLYAILWFMEKAGDHWWMGCSLFVFGFQMLMLVLYPTLIAPFFNRFVPLEDGELKTALESLSQKCRFATQGIYVMDGSKRSTHSNAYFTGLGRARRIVLYDTLVKQLTVQELCAVLAHEIGHYKKRHIQKHLILSGVMTLLAFYVLSLLIHWKPLYEAFPVGEPTIAKGLLLFSFLASTFTFWIEPLLHRLSRSHEYEADAYAVEQTHDTKPMAGALLKLSEKNLSNLTPHPAYSAYHYSHPTLLERLSAIENQTKPSYSAE